MTNIARMCDPHHADRVALISRNRPITYGELRDQSSRFRGGLLRAGIEPGDRVAIVCGNNHYFVIAYLAVVGMGAIVVPLNPASPAPELEEELAVVEPTAVVLGPRVRSHWTGVDRTAVPSIRRVVVAETDPEGDELTFGSMLEGDPSPIVDVDPDQVAALLFTSGTAGPPKAAMLTHGNLTTNIAQDLATRDHISAGDVVYGVLPLFHIFGLNVLLGVSLTVGATILLVQRFDPATAAESIVQRGITAVPGAPPMWIAFCHFDELPDDTFANVRIAASGAAKLPLSIAEQFRERFGLAIHEGYGLTEAGPIVTSSQGLPYRPGSVGRVLTGQELRVVDEHDNDVPVGDAGNILVRGDNVFVGYWNDPEATARVLADGWLHTGDVGVVDEEGYLYLVDRSKDLIIVSGFNVYPAEVEHVLQTHPDVSEVGVIGVPHPHHGEAVRAYVVTRPGADLDEESLIEYALDHLARYKCPTKILFADELPRNSAGKLIRRELQGTVLADP